MTETADQIYDIAIIGGGINGCGIARDAAGRGLKVLLAEQGDLAQGTSSASSKLIHGGLRYLEHYEFRLVRESLTEREILWQMAPHIIHPMRFILPHHKALRPAWLLRLGLFMYDHIGGRKKLPATKTIDLTNDRTGTPLINEFRKGFEYSDCWVDDARLVVLNAIDARQRGADIFTRTRCVAAQRENAVWQVTLQDVKTGQTRTIQARSLINATGPWVDHLLDKTQLKVSEKKNVRLVRGSHLIVPRIYQHDRAYIFQNADNRILFAIPYEQDFTLLGTTDADHHDNLDTVKISEDEAQYICDAASVYFKRPVKREDVIRTYSGVRPLYDDGASAAQEATRDYVLKLHDDSNKAPLLNIFGGKITTYRRLAEDALEKLQPYLGNEKAAWTAGSTLPGGDFDADDFEDLIKKLQSDYPFITPAWADSLIRRYGTRAWLMLGDAETPEDLGQDFGATLTEAEAHFLVETEWAGDTEDILWRRSKIGLHMTQQQRDNFRHWFYEKKTPSRH